MNCFALSRIDHERLEYGIKFFKLFLHYILSIFNVVTVLNDTNELSKIKWPVLGIFGEQDQSIPIESVIAFEQVLNETGVINEIYIYPGVGHAFANPSDNYALKEAADAWKRTLTFLNQYV